MMIQWANIRSLAHIIFLDGIRRYALLGLLLLSLFTEATGIFFMDFISHDVGRASSDYLFSIMWLAGILFLFFHAVQVISWDEERGVIYSILSRPLSRSAYVLGVFTGLALLLIALQLSLGLVAFLTLSWIQSMLDPVYFPVLSTSHFVLTLLGIVAAQLVLLSVVMLFSGLVRGGFPVLLLSLAYYAICTALPTVRESIASSVTANSNTETTSLLLQTLSAIFPDLTLLDFKNSVVLQQWPSHFLDTFGYFLLFMLYSGIIMTCACMAYNRRDLQ